MAHWIGYLVSIKCGNNLGTFQGEIVDATSSTISLNKTFCNGIPFGNQNEPVQIRAEDIVDLKLIDKLSSPPQQSSTITIAKPVPKRANQRSVSLSETLNKSLNKTKVIDNESKLSQNDPVSIKTNTPGKRDKNNARKWGWKDEECFGIPNVDQISDDFDFEKNLALFNKQKIWDQLNSNNQKPDIIKQTEAKRPTKYRHDENVIASIPVAYRQIKVPAFESQEYVTDDGLVVPCINTTLRTQLFDCMEKAGLSWERVVELMGRSATEISLQLLGGGHRLNPNNSHQFPTVVLFCGNDRRGAMGINAARQLSSHNVRTLIHTTASISNKNVITELALYRLTKLPVVTKMSDLPIIADLVIVASLDDLQSDWIVSNRAPILAIDPPSDGISNIHPKFSLLPILPLPQSPDNGRLYLCNLAIPSAIFNKVGIKYRSPFGPKFVIPLYPKNDC